MVLLEGKPIADEIKADIQRLAGEMSESYRLGIVMVGENPASKKFVQMKQRFAHDVGIETQVYSFEESITTTELRKRMKDIVHESRNNGVVVQLPLPDHIETQSILNAVTPEKDVDMLSARAVGDFQVGKASVLPPVVCAVRALFQKHSIHLGGRSVAIIGYGRLVGQPLSVWCMQEGALVTPLSSPENFDADILRRADIIISGIGKPRFIKGEYVKEGVVIIDVGTSEAEGKLVGDVDFESVKEKASYITPVPGGIGPLTVACLFQNLITLARRS